MRSIYRPSIRSLRDLKHGLNGQLWNLHGLQTIPLTFDRVGSTNMSAPRVLMLEEPCLSKVKGIVCRPCKIHNCPFKPCFKSLSDLMDGRYMDRIERGDQ